MKLWVQTVSRSAGFFFFKTTMWSLKKCTVPLQSRLTENDDSFYVPSIIAKRATNKAQTLTDKSLSPRVFQRGN